MNALENFHRWLKGLLLFSCLLPFVSRGPVFAQCTLTGSEYQVNTYVQDFQDSASVAGLTGSGSLVTWEGSGHDGSCNGVYCQRFSFRNRLVLNFGPGYGLYQYDQAGGWKQWNTVSPSDMVTVDLNGDDADELIAAFPGYGLYIKDSANDWQPINTFIPEGIISFRNGIACDYGSAYGQWLWDRTRGWRQINAFDPGKMIAADIDRDAEDELVTSFVGYGLYYYDVPGVWTQINTVIPEHMIPLNSGIVCDFGAAHGLWYWTQAGGWEPLNAVDPEQMLAVDINNDGTDELVASFDAYGLYWRYETGPWTPINTVIPENVIRLNSGLACDFGATYGLWIWTQTGGWVQRTPLDPEQMTVVDIDKDSVEELVVSFSDYGLYSFDETDSWQLLNAVVPVDMKPCIYKPDYVPCLSDDTCMDGQVCDRSECLSCCPGSTGVCIDVCCGRCQAKPSCKDQTYSRACREDADCTCGINVITKECDYGIAECINELQQCPDFCTGIAGNLEIVCKDNQCVQVVKPTGCTTDADCRYGAEWCEDGACVACDNSGVFCDLYCKNGMIDRRNGCQPCICRRDYVPCLSDEACGDGQICDRSECLSCCPGSTGACILACCGKCVDKLGGFCGWSSNASCASDADCMTGGCSGQVCQSINEEPVITTCEWTECYSAEAYGVICGCINATCQWR